MRKLPIAILSLLAAMASSAMAAEPTQAGPCGLEGCRYRVTAAELLQKAEQLVFARDFATATPLVEALGQAPGYDLQHHFLLGYIAIESGETETAIKHFRAALKNHPGQTRVRLELARALLLKGERNSADYHYRLAESASDLPDEIAATIRATRGVLRTERNWRFNFDFGFAPDTNINNATSAETVDVNLGFGTLPLELDENARRRSGIGQTGSFSGSLRLPMSERLGLVIDGDGQGTNYKGKAADDFSVQLAVGPELRLSEATSITLQPTALNRWFGGDRAATQFGLRAGLQSVLDEGQRLGIQLDARHTDSGFDPIYDGWTLGAFATYERVIGKSMIASASLFARRDLLRSEAFSSLEGGFSVGIGGELPWGINAGVNAGLSRAVFDAPLPVFSSADRKDWRSTARLFVGSRALRLLGFSPSLSYSFTRTSTNYELYRADRHRLRFALARYF